MADLLSHRFINEINIYETAQDDHHRLLMPNDGPT